MKWQFKEKFDSFLIDLKHQKKTSTQIDSQTDSLAFLFLSCFHFFVPTVFSSGSLICKQTVKKSLKAETTNREGKTTFIIIIISIMRAEQLSCLTVSVSYLSVCQTNVDKLRLQGLKHRTSEMSSSAEIIPLFFKNQSTTIINLDYWSESDWSNKNYSVTQKFSRILVWTETNIKSCTIN